MLSRNINFSVTDKFTENIKINPELSHIIPYDIKCDDNKNEKMCNKYQVPGYPYVIIEINNKKIPYEGKRTALDLLKFIKKY